MRKYFALAIAIAQFICIAVFILAINDWGAVAPPPIAQLFWALSLVGWPWLTYEKLKGR